MAHQLYISVMLQWQGWCPGDEGLKAPQSSSQSDPRLESGGCGQGATQAAEPRTGAAGAAHSVL